MSERHTNFLLSVAVLGGIAAVAYADWVVQTISLAYLYLLPLALSALVHRLRTSLGLALLCVFLHDSFGPFTDTGWMAIARNLLTLVGFVTAVLFVNHLQRQRVRLNEVVRHQRDELQRDLALAAEVQQRLLPREFPAREGLDLAGVMYPARTVAGDYFDFIELPGGDIGLAVADVAGKGVSSALLMPAVETALRMDAPTRSDAHEIALTLNQLLCDLTDDFRYVTLFYGKLDVERRRLQYTNAGHVPPLVMSDNLAEPRWLTKGGPVLGLLAGRQYESETLQLEPGSVLVLYTDGLIEATNAGGEEYSQERLLAFVRANAAKPAAEIIEGLHADIVAFQGSDVFADDFTLVVLRVR